MKNHSFLLSDIAIYGAILLLDSPVNQVNIKFLHHMSFGLRQDEVIMNLGYINSEQIFLILN